jgi:hypothetical protein
VSTGVVLSDAWITHHLPMPNVARRRGNTYLAVLQETAPAAGQVEAIVTQQHQAFLQHQQQLQQWQQQWQQPQQQWQYWQLAVRFHALGVVSAVTPFLCA